MMLHARAYPSFMCSYVVCHVYEKHDAHACYSGGTVHSGTHHVTPLTILRLVGVSSSPSTESLFAFVGTQAGATRGFRGQMQRAMRGMNRTFGPLEQLLGRANAEDIGVRA